MKETPAHKNKQSKTQILVPKQNYKALRLLPVAPDHVGQMDLYYFLDDIYIKTNYPKCLTVTSSKYLVSMECRSSHSTYQWLCKRFTVRYWGYIRWRHHKNPPRAMILRNKITDVHIFCWTSYLRMFPNIVHLLLWRDNIQMFPYPSVSIRLPKSP